MIHPWLASANDTARMTEPGRSLPAEEVSQDDPPSDVNWTLMLPLALDVAIQPWVTSAKSITGDDKAAA